MEIAITTAQNRRHSQHNANRTLFQPSVFAVFSPLIFSMITKIAAFFTPFSPRFFRFQPLFITIFKNNFVLFLIYTKYKHKAHNVKKHSPIKSLFQPSVFAVFSPLISCQLTKKMTFCTSFSPRFFHFQPFLLFL